MGVLFFIKAPQVILTCSSIWEPMAKRDLAQRRPWQYLPGSFLSQPSSLDSCGVEVRGREEAKQQVSLLQDLLETGVPRSQLAPGKQGGNPGGLPLHQGQTSVFSLRALGKPGEPNSRGTRTCASATLCPRMERDWVRAGGTSCTPAGTRPGAGSLGGWAPRKKPYQTGDSHS